MRFGVEAIGCSHLPSLFSHSEKGFCRNWGIFSRLVPQSRKEVAKWRRAPTSSAAANAARPGATSRQHYCEDCFSPLEITYDYDSLRSRLSRELFASRAPNMWRYRELLPLPAAFQPSLPVGFTPLVSAPRSAKDRIAAALRQE
jgi:hypothetical protein